MRISRVSLSKLLTFIGLFCHGAVSLADLKSSVYVSHFSGQSQYSSANKTQYNGESVNLNFDYQLNNQVKLGLSANYKQKQSREYKIEAPEVATSRGKETGWLNPAASATYKINLLENVSSLRLKLKGSPSLGPRQQNSNELGEWNSEARSGYSYFDTGASYDHNFDSFNMGTFFNYRNTSRGQKIYNNKPLSFDPEKWYSGGAYLSINRES